ncbi:hypothetical protein EJ03DRAFT_345332 [Teratosphaeria nubilosa]|uniref:Large ribosomal subunit protein bL28m n=1 Tax=Teratosphaeria nubilosa TaxID=161662 RepID=A0A6G1L0H6_9PEZI|nr:hypothetical protein EJ03DRAFT_345332 [Teratosphaeria nubilosa]
MAALFRPRPRSALCQCQRAFSTTVPRSVSLQVYRNDPDAVADTVPAYPYGPARWYKQSDLGLYGGQKIRFGNNVGPEFGVKTRRSWHPNIHNKRLWSKALDRSVQVRVSTRVLRTIDKVGGLDEYLLGEKEARIRELGMSGWWLRWAIMQTPTVKRRFAEERARLRVPVEQIEQEQREADEATAVISEASEAEVEAATTNGEAVDIDAEH